jgi:hypothetical protein
MRMTTNTRSVPAACVDRYSRSGANVKPVQAVHHGQRLVDDDVDRVDVSGVAARGLGGQPIDRRLRSRVATDPSVRIALRDNDGIPFDATGLLYERVRPSSLIAAQGYALNEEAKASEELDEVGVTGESVT